jgi:hypothetical protein
MTTTLQLVLTWQDEFITWDKNIYENDLAFRFNEIWVPSLISGNNLVNFKIDSTKGYELDLNFYSIFDLAERKRYLISVDSTGKCTWKYPLKLMTVCQLNQQIFPFDSQECFIDFRPSAFYSNQLNLISRTKVNFNKIKDSEFELINVETSDNFHNSETNNQSISYTRVTFLIKRKMIFYSNKIILPYFVFYVATLFTYILPVDSGEKKSLSTSILISSFYFFKDCLSFVSKTSFLSLLSLYFNLNLVFVFLCIVFTTIVYSIYYIKRHNKPVSKLLIFFFGDSDLKQNDIKKEIFWQTQRQKMDENFDKLNLFECRSKHTDGHLKEKIKGELAKINTQLLEFEHRSMSVPRIITKKTVDVKHFLAFKHLNVLKKFKTLIVAHNNAQQVAKSHVFNYQNKPSSLKIFDSSNKSLKIFSLMNTLENLKIEILKNKKHKKKSKTDFSHNNNNNLLGVYYNGLASDFKASNQNRGSVEFSDYLRRREENEQNARNARLFLEIVQNYKMCIEFHLEKLENKIIRYRRNFGEDESLSLGYKNEWKSLAINIDTKLFYTFVILVTSCIFYLYLKAILII